MLPKVLLVDDRPSNHRALEAVLEGFGAELVRATSSEEALRQLLDPELALIVLDVRARGLDAFEAASLIREGRAHRAIPLVFLGAAPADPSQLRRACELGAVDHWLEPFEPHLLRAKVSVFLELFRAREELRRAGDAKDLFLAAATHELRTPVAAGQAILQLGLRRLRKGRDANPIEVLETAEEQLKRLAHLVDDLLDTARLANGALSLETSDVDLTALVAGVVARFAAMEPARRFGVEASPAVAIRGDASRLEQVLTNLLANALRYSPAGSPVQVQLRPDGDDVVLAVKDRGIGVPEAQKQAIFARFARAHGTRYGGLGLGLDIARGIVEQHGGTIEVDSEGIEGRGSTFRVRLPSKGRA